MRRRQRQLSFDRFESRFLLSDAGFLSDGGVIQSDDPTKPIQIETGGLMPTMIPRPTTQIGTAESVGENTGDWPQPEPGLT